MNNKVFLKRMLALGMPIALQNLLSSCGYLVDTAMVVGLGNVATSAIGVASRWSFLMSVVTFGVASGCSTLVAQYWGAGERGRIRKTAGFAFLAVAAISAVYIVLALMAPRPMMQMFTDEEAVISAGLGYIRIASFSMLFGGLTIVAGASMRATEDVRSPFIASTCGVAVNTFLNYCLIYGHFGMPRMGLEGAALATVISNAVQFAVIMAMAARKKSLFLGPVSEMFGWGREFVSKYLSVAMPILINEAAWAVGTTLYSAILARQGSENYSAYTIANSAKEIFYVLFIGLCNACAIMVGKAVGENKPDEAYDLGRRYLLSVPVISLILGAIEIMTRNPLLSLMSIETEGARLTAANLLVLHGMLMTFLNLPYVAVIGIFRAGGDTKYGAVIDVLTVYMAGLPALWATAYLTDASFITMVAVMNLAECVPKCLMCIHRFRSRRWIRRLV